MRKLKREILNKIYIAIFTAIICGIVMLPVEWQYTFVVGFAPFWLLYSLFDERYDRHFEKEKTNDN